MQIRIIAGLIGLLLVVALIPAMHADEGSSDIQADVRMDANNTNHSGEGKDHAEIKVVARARAVAPKPPFGNGDMRTHTMNGTNVSARIEARGEVRVDRQERRKELLDDVKEARQNLREDRQAFVEKVKTEIAADRDKIRELRGSYEDQKKAYVEARAEVKGHCETNKSEDCRKARQELNNNAKEFMGNAAEQMLRIISSVEARVEASDLDDETSADVIARLDANKDAITTAQANVEALANSSDVNATKAAAAELRAAWVDARVSIKLTEGLLAIERFDGFLGNLEHMQTRFNEARDKLAAEGKDVTQLDADIASFDAKISAASTAYAEVESSYVSGMASVKTEAEAETLMKASREKIQSIKDGLNAARDDLRAILKDIRTLSVDALTAVAQAVAADAAVSAEEEVTV